MNKLISILALSACSLSVNVTQAALFDRGGGLIYDDVLNVTWLQDANYARTSGYSTDGRMSWGEAISWVVDLSFYDSVRGVTYDDWRLPSISSIKGPGFGISTIGPSYNGTTDWGWNVSAPGTIYEGSTASELANLFYNSLNNIAFFDLDETVNPAWSFGHWNSGPFVNIMGAYTIDRSYWGGIRGLGTSWGFDFYDGQQQQMGG